MIHVAIAEDHQSLIDGLQLLFEYDDDIQLVGSANNGQALLELIEKKVPDIVLTDIRMPIMDGIALTKHLKQHHPNIKVIAFTMYDQQEAVEQMLAAGAVGYILKNSSLKEVHKAILEVAAGNTHYDANITVKEQTKRPKHSILTKRQAEILELIGMGKTTREIADELFIGVQTVDTHRKNMIRILGLQGKGELMRYALERRYRF